MAGKREQLMASAEALFYARGFHATGIDQIVQAAGVVRMTLYNHFRSKEALVTAVLRERHERFLATLDAAVADAPAGSATLALVDAHGAWLEAHGDRGCILVRAMGEFAEHSRAVFDQAVEAKQTLRGRLRDALARDGYPAGGDLEGELFLTLEGSNAAVPVMGAAAATRATRRGAERLLRGAGEAVP